MWTPTSSGPWPTQIQVCFYGLRPPDPSCFFLSPWEFVQWWEPIRLAKPSAEYRFTKWREPCNEQRAEPGLDYDVDISYCVHPNVLVFPKREAGEKYNRFRSSWILLRRIHPVVPCPENSPLPSKKMTLEDRSKIFSVYLRPWTLVPEESTCEVPFLVNLNKTKEQWAESVADNLSFRNAWKNYLTRIPPTSINQIRNFMLAVVAEGRSPARDGTAIDAASRGKPVVCKLNPGRIEELVHVALPEKMA